VLILIFIVCFIHDQKLATLRVTVEKERATNERLKRMKVNLLFFQTHSRFLFFFFPLKSLLLFQKFRSWLCSNLKYIAIPKLTRTLFFCMCFCT
jgi:hypothetical protein